MRGRGLVLAASALVLVPTLATAAAETRPTLTFAPATRSFTWGQLKRRVPIEVTNETPRLVHLSFLVSPFRNGDISFRERLAAVTPTKRTVGAGGSTVVWLVVWTPPRKKTRTSDTPDDPPPSPAQPPRKPGSYNGSLVAYEARGTVFARLPLVLSVGATSNKVVPEPLVDSRSVTVHRCVWFWSGCHHTVAAGRVKLELKKSVRKGKQLALTRQRLGVIKTGDDVVAVRWDGKKASKDAAGTSAIGLRFSRFDGAGKYSGKVDLLPDDKKAGDVSLTVTFTDGIFWPLIAIGLGVLTGFAVTRLIGVTMPYRRLRALIMRKRRDYDNSYQSFRAAAQGKPWIGYELAATVVDKIEADLLRAASELHRTYLGKIPTEKLANFATKIDSDFGPVMFFETFTTELAQLDAKITELAAQPPLQLPGIDLAPPPYAETTLRELLGGRPYDNLGQFTGAHTAVQQAPADVDEWRGLETKLRQIEADIRQYGGNGALDPPFVPLQEGLETLYLSLWRDTRAADANASLDAPVTTLRRDVNAAIAGQPIPGEGVGAAPGGTAEVEEEIARARVKREGAQRLGLSQLLGMLSSLGAARPSPTTVSDFFAAIGAALWGAAVWLGAFVVGLFSTVVSALWGAGRWLYAAVDERVGWDVVGLLILGLILAVASGLSTEYAGKVVGGAWDYVKLFLWGFGTKVLLDTFVSGLDAIGVVRALRR